MHVLITAAIYSPATHVTAMTIARFHELINPPALVTM